MSRKNPPPVRFPNTLRVPLTDGNSASIAVPILSISAKSAPEICRQTLMILSACLTRRVRCLRFHFQCPGMDSDFFIEAEVSGSGTSDKPPSTTERQALECPLHENQKLIPEGDEIHHVHTGPHNPGKQA